MKQTMHIFPSTEVVGSILTTQIDKPAMESIEANPSDYFKSNFDIDINDLDFSFVENSQDDVNLVLPYYSTIETFKSAYLTDKDLNKVSGGEIFITLSLVIGSAVGFAAFGTSTGLAAGAAVGGIIGITAATVGTAAVVGTIAGQKNADKRAAASISVGAANTLPTPAAANQGGK